MKQESYSRIILFTAFKTALIVVGVFCLFLSYVWVFNPNVLAGVYDKFGMGNAEIGTYEQIYAKSGKNADLYNLVQKCLSAEKYAKAKAYILELQANTDYDSFVAGVDAASIQKAEKSEVAFVVSLDAYLSSQLLVCEYRLGNKLEAKQMALEDLDKTENKYLFLLGVLYDEVLTDLDYTIAEAQNQLIEIFNANGVRGKIDAKISASDYMLETDEKLKIASVYNQMKIMNYKRNLMRFVGDDDADISADIQDLKTLYNSLI